MMSEVSLSRIEQLFLGIACELRPALAEGDPSMSVLESVALLHLVRPTERVGLCNPGVHARHDACGPLSIRFQIVAGVG
jgi:hypothetical protein